MPNQKLGKRARQVFDLFLAVRVLDLTSAVECLMRC